MLAVASSSASPVNSWPSACGSSEYSPAQLSGACALLALLARSQGSTQSASKNDIEINAHKLDELKKELAETIQKAKDAANDSGFFGFLGDVFGSDIAQIAGAVAAVAAVVATAGTATPVLMIAIAEGLQLGAKAGAELGLDPYACMALSLASVAVGLCTGSAGLQMASKLAEVGRDVELGAKFIQGASTIAGGALHYTSAQYHAKSLCYQADAVGYQANEQTTNLSFEDALSMLQRALRAEQHETNTASEIVHNDSDTNTALSDRI